MNSAAISLEFWVYMPERSDLTTTPSLLSIPDLTYRLVLQQDASTAKEQLASWTPSATHAISFSLPVAQWHHLALGLESQAASLFSNSHSVLARAAHSDLSLSDFSSVYFCGNEASSAQTMASCSIR